MQRAAAVAMIVAVCTFWLATQSGGQGLGIPVDAVGRVLVGEYGGICTGFVVRSQQFVMWARGYEAVFFRNYVVTAGHCGVRGEPYLFIRARDPFAHAIYLIGFSTGRSREYGLGHDIAVFIFSTREPQTVLEPLFDARLEPGEPLMSVGYGNRALMARVGPFLGLDAQGYLRVDNSVSKGNSGGPVLRAGTRQVVGVMIEGHARLEAICPAARCWNSETYVATPIDRLLGILRW